MYFYICISIEECFQKSLISSNSTWNLKYISIYTDIELVCHLNSLISHLRYVSQLTQMEHICSSWEIVTISERIGRDLATFGRCIFRSELVLHCGFVKTLIWGPFYRSAERSQLAGWTSWWLNGQGWSPRRSGRCLTKFEDRRVSDWTTKVRSSSAGTKMTSPNLNRLFCS